MSAGTLRAALEEYLAVRRSLGFKLTHYGPLLEQFVSHCEDAGADRVSVEVAMSWVTQPGPQTSPSWLRTRLSMVRGFAAWLQAADPATEVPPTGWLPTVRRPVPYLYSQADIAALLAAAGQVRGPLAEATYETLIGLVTVTGMRAGEAVRLNRADVSFEDCLVTVWGSKFGKSRQLPLHPTAVAALRRYSHRRALLSPAPQEPAFFVHPAGNRISQSSVQAMFRVLAARAGLKPRSPRCRPTMHGLRHTFAVNTLTRWHREGLDVQARLPLLSTWLGHADPKWTYWYLSACPELLAAVADRLESSPGKRS